MSDIIIIGFVTIDFIGHAEGFPVAGIPMQAAGLDVACGGRAANQAMALAAVESEVTLIARLGEDEHADLLKGELIDLGVDIEHVSTAPSVTGVRLITELPNGEQAILIHRGANDFLSADDVNRRAEVFAEAKVVSVTTEPAGAVVLRALERAAAGKATRVLTHAAGAKHVSDRVLAATDIVLVSDATCHGLLDPGMASRQPEAAARALCQRGAPNVVLLTRDRAILATATNVRHVQSPGSLDSEDAVDAFAAGLLQGLAMDESIEEAIVRGVRVGNLLVD